MRFRNFLVSLGFIGALASPSFSEVNIDKLIEFLAKRNGIVAKVDTVNGIPRELSMKLQQFSIEGNEYNVIRARMVGYGHSIDEYVFYDGADDLANGVYRTADGVVDSEFLPPIRYSYRNADGELIEQVTIDFPLAQSIYESIAYNFLREDLEEDISN